MTACIQYLNTGERHKKGECKACDKEYYNEKVMYRWNKKNS